MAYLPNKPAANDLLSNSQGDIQGNFLTANTVIAINHFPFDDVSTNSGKHKFVTMPLFSATVFPPPTTIPANIAGEGVIYTLNANSVSTSNEVNLFYTPGTTPASVDAYQLTRTITTAAAQFGTQTNYPTAVPNQIGGWTFLPGGLLLQYGQMICTGATTDVVFPVSFTDNASPYSITATRNNNSSSTTSYGIPQATKTGFKFAQSATSGATYYWMAIGK